MRKIKTETIVKGDYLYAIATNPYAGRRNRYTVFRLQLGGLNRTKVIGRELPLGLSRRLIRNDVPESR